MTDRRDLNPTVGHCRTHGEYEALPGPDQWCPHCAEAAAIRDANHDYRNTEA